MNENIAGFTRRLNQIIIKTKLGLLPLLVGDLIYIGKIRDLVENYRANRARNKIFVSEAEELEELLLCFDKLEVKGEED